jgi:phosphatidylglycerophosphatase C
VRKLCVFDLDGTLIPHDSFSRLVRENMTSRPSLLVAALARRAGILSRAGFAEFAHQKLADKLDPAVNEVLVADILSAVMPERRARIEEWRGKGALLVLLSASPHEYVSAVGSALGFEASFGSRMQDGRYLHLHGSAKRKFIDARFPPDEWLRCYAIADSDSDSDLLSCFETGERV